MVFLLSKMAILFQKFHFFNINETEAVASKTISSTTLVGECFHANYVTFRSCAGD